MLLPPHVFAGISHCQVFAGNCCCQQFRLGSYWYGLSLAVASLQIPLTVAYFAGAGFTVITNLSAPLSEYVGCLSTKEIRRRPPLTVYIVPLSLPQRWSMGQRPISSVRGPPIAQRREWS